MEQQKSKRREWVKTVAIIFLSVLLVLTFFSNTILNYSLPEVAAQYCNSGTITTKIRGNGTVETSDPYSVILKESRKVDSVAVYVGDEVEKDQVLYYLEESESKELDEAEKALKTLQETYEKEIIAGNIGSNITNEIATGNAGSLQANQAKIDAAKAKVTSAENNVKAYQNQVTDLTNQITTWKTGSAASLAERKILIDAQTNKDAWTAQKNYTTALVANTSTVLQTAKDALADLSSNDPSEVAAAQTAVTNAQRAYDEASLSDRTATIKLAEAENNVVSAQRTIDEKVDTLEYQLQLANTNLAASNTALTDAEAKLKEITDEIGTKIDLVAQLSAIEEQKKVVEKLREQSGGSTIKAPVAGRVLSLGVVAGETIEQGATVATIQVAGKAFTLSFPVTTEQAKMISIGDEAELTNYWGYNDVTAKVLSIKPDPSNPGKSKLVTFELDGDVTSGQKLSLSVGSRSANYDCIVPKSALREDNNGKFILIVESKNTPLGNRYVAQRVDVEVLASDDTQAAVSGALYGWEYVITTATKPVDAGKQVRLAD